MRRSSARRHMVPESRQIRTQSVFRRYWVWFFLDFVFIIGIFVLLILFNNRSKMLTKDILELQKEVRAAEELKDKLEVERAWMISTAKLREKAEKLGMREALKGQIRSR